MGYKLQYIWHDVIIIHSYARAALPCASVPRVNNYANYMDAIWSVNRRLISMRTRSFCFNCFRLLFLNGIFVLSYCGFKYIIIVLFLKILYFFPGFFLPSLVNSLCLYDVCLHNVCMMCKTLYTWNYRWITYRWL